MQVGYRSFGFLRRTFRLYTLTTQNNLTPPLFQILVFKKQYGGAIQWLFNGVSEDGEAYVAVRHAARHAAGHQGIFGMPRCREASSMRDPRTRGADGGWRLCFVFLMIDE